MFRCILKLLNAPRFVLSAKRSVCEKHEVFPPYSITCRFCRFRCIPWSHVIAINLLHRQRHYKWAKPNSLTKYRDWGAVIGLCICEHVVCTPERNELYVVPDACVYERRQIPDTIMFNLHVRVCSSCSICIPFASVFNWHVFFCVYVVYNRRYTRLLVILYVFNYKMFHQEASVEIIKMT